VSSQRLPSGGRINRGRPLEFFFNGRRYEGFEGDTLASGLLANGIRLFGRSFKYHRPRGVFGSGSEEPNAIVQLGEGASTIPNLKATQVELFNGLSARTVVGWPSLEIDLYAINNRIGRLLPAGFYYKTFMRPRFLWDWYEGRIRHAAGLGFAPTEPDSARYDKRNAHCDVLVVGAGPTGLMAALVAGRSGARVIVADEQAEMGGDLLSSTQHVSGACPWMFLDNLVKELSLMDNVMLLPRSTVSGYYDYNFLVINQRRTDHQAGIGDIVSRERNWRVRARQVVLATGAIERGLVFADNDRPGIMLSSAVRTYINRYAVRPGGTGAVFTNNDSAYQTAVEMHGAGMEVKGVIDVRQRPSQERLLQMDALDIPVYSGHGVGGTRSSRQGLRAVELCRLSADGRDVLTQKGSLDCQVLAISGGWNPAIHLHCQSGGRPKYDDDQACFVPDKSVQSERSAGSALGIFQLGNCLSDGIDAGVHAVRETGYACAHIDIPYASDRTGSAIEPMWNVPDGVLPGRGGKKFVDYQNDTTAADIALAAREGYRSIEHVKRYTALGFGTDQGKTGNINGLAILAQHLGQSIPATGTTTFRPNYTPVTFGAIAGRELGTVFFDPVRKTPMHDWHVAHGAVFEDVGQWKRPWYYPKGGETMESAVRRECLATRKSIGLLDASTLGKIEVRGRDSAEFLNRIYTNAWSKLEINRCRYGLMLGEDGMVMDDGVSSRLGDNHYYMTTTTGGAAHVLGWLERWHQTEWPELEVFFTSVTDRWAVASIAGPNSRSLLDRLCSDIDLSAGAFPFMSLREGSVAGISARLFRISFSGELAFEINVSADDGVALWELLMEAGGEYGITPYGTETMHVLRAEKGYVIVGQDTDGSVTPADLGMDWIVSKTKDFIGKRSLVRSDMLRDNRKQLVGLVTEQPETVLPEGTQLVNEPSTDYPVPMTGHVTSSYYSSTLGHSIALALIKGGHTRMGASVYAPTLDGQCIKAIISSPVFYDPENKLHKT